MKRLLFVIPIGLLATAYLNESFALLMASMSALFLAAAANFIYLRSCYLVLASVSFSLVLAEASLSRTSSVPGGHVTFYYPDDGGPVRIWQVHDAYGMLPQPGQYQAIKRTDGGDLVYDVLYTIGRDGFRYTPQPQKSYGKKAFFLGDSATFGEGLNDDQTLPFHWARLNPEYQVKNFGMSAWGLHQAYVVWRDLIYDEGALVFVQTAPWHSDRSACIPEFSTFSPRFEIINGSIFQNGKCRMLLGVNFVDRVLNKSKVVSRIYNVTHRGDQTHKFELYLAIVREMLHLAQEREQYLVIVFNKAENSYFEDSTYDNEEILRLLREAGAEVVNVTLADRKEDLDPSYVIPLDGHPSDRANRAKARLLIAPAIRCAISDDVMRNGAAPADAARAVAAEPIRGGQDSPGRCCAVDGDARRCPNRVFP
jgi:hypothetical protein